MNQRLEEYVDTVSTGLKGLPANEREAEVAELRQHLTALIQSRSELGEPEETVVITAIEQFGSAPTVCQRLLTTYRRRKFARFCRSWPGAVLVTVCSFLLVMILSSVIFEPLMRQVNGFVDPQTAALLGFFRIGGSFLLLGWIAGRLSGAKCLPILAAYSLFFYAVYLAPQLRHDDMPVAIRTQIWVSGILFMAAPLLSAFVASRSFATLRKA